MTFALIALTVLYAGGWHRIRRALPKLIPAWRLIAFAGGIIALWLAVGSPLAELDEQLLTAHMVQHLLLMIVAAPLILLGAPSITLLHGLPRRFVRDMLGPFLRLRPAHRVGAFCTHPVFCLLAASVVVIGWHVPAAFDLGLRSHGWHEIEHASFFTAGLLFWWPVIQPWPSVAAPPRWWVPLYLFLATLPCDALSAFLTFCDYVVYRPYLSSDAFDLTPLQDQALAGALMWVTVTFAYLIPALIVTMRILSGPRSQTSEVEVF
ncbi:MAG: 4Fe-4S ferredoxin, iron-sulfur binding domain protein [Bryobacterales bacterium]|nr:4Fe-4S ferredoxin, iron-sulfur binding domain protein [Bryobacterales bacterium]